MDRSGALARRPEQDAALGGFAHRIRPERLAGVLHGFTGAKVELKCVERADDPPRSYEAVRERPAAMRALGLRGEQLARSRAKDRHSFGSYMENAPFARRNHR
jgi:hypothetical protein